MYHIVFSADENYIKYTAVLITSIVLNTKQNSNCKDEKYFFHILSNLVSNSTQKKLLKLQNNLNKIFSCEIVIHIYDDHDFAKFPFSGAAHNSKIPYYRLKLSSIFDNSVKKCLYLDSDMLCMCDIRELFAIDLKDKIIGAVGDIGSKKSKIKYIKDNKKMIFKFNENYFNSGLLLINLEEYKKQNIEKKCENLASKCYYIKAADQDLLNATIQSQYLVKLDFSYNFSVIAFCYVVCKDENKYKLNYTRDEFNQSIKNPKILHYGEKPWKYLKSYFDYNGKNINDYWWDIAYKTPIFNKELLENKNKIINHLLCAGLGYELLNATLRCNLLKIKFLVKNTSHDQKYIQKAKSIQNDIFGVCCILGVAVLYARAYNKNFFSVYLKALKIIYHFKKYSNL
ncbi:glycosyltransferase family 8 protein [Campylobacter hepaticus]|uniref:Glycosyltransferase family 8 protein n=1 Tax=Campylobacter hepaticus TaxID=1813019 RepID=A0A6A7JUD5_9BACT|nr:glycosyltransferase family 8 protein [Campylobacter hepaticus]AXP08377.1 glycosyltransferase family 8 protein [Campylobacter hepaticus]MCZ0772203.1 glycosyltransferase family 8 protein [Campylobacter hepaticus]MCZ0773671.1 glycosyltransferase family 8 protein [Campylobacter hepaticus]MCZ0774922.1 glycosyltransferase family 8 protein [Campylobacter hepaticus]MPV54844.1 glycosyltransferase family 8 protein [Campylobacter hepaticus]